MVLGKKLIEDGGLPEKGSKWSAVPKNNQLVNDTNTQDPSHHADANGHKVTCH